MEDDQSLFEMLEQVDDLEGLFSDEPNVRSLIVGGLGAGGQSESVDRHEDLSDDEDEKEDLELLQGLLHRLKEKKETLPSNEMSRVELPNRWKKMNEEDSLKYLLGEIESALLNASKMKNLLVEFEERLIEIADGVLSQWSASTSKCLSTVRGYYAVNSEKFIKSFAKPYFKTATGFDSPKVPHVENYLPCDPDTLPPTLFNENELLDLRSAVINSYRCQLQDEAVRKKDAGAIAELSKMDDEELSERLTPRRESQLNWDDISSRTMNFLPSECQRLWFLYPSPGVNKEKWSAEENDKIKSLAVKYNYQNWDEIALELGTSRTGYQCFVHYHSALDREKTGPWTPMEDEYFNKIVSMSSFGKHIVWPKVFYYMESRGVIQLARRYRVLNDTRKLGKFSLKEDEFLMRNINKILSVGASKCLNKNLDRNIVQVSSRVRDHLKKSLTCRYNEWTEEEDRLLLRLYDRFGETTDCFSKIAKHFKTRNRSQIRHRYNRLRSLLERDPDLDLSRLRRNKISVGNARRNEVLKLAHELEFSCGESSEEEDSACAEKSGSESDSGDELDEEIMDFFKKDHFPLNVKLKTSQLNHHVSLMEKAVRFVYHNNSQLSELNRKKIKLLSESDNFVYEKILENIIRSRNFPPIKPPHDQPTTSTAQPTSTLEPLFPDLISLEALAHIYEKIEWNRNVSQLQRRIARGRQQNQELSDWFAVCEIIFTWPILLSMLNKKQEEELKNKIDQNQ